MFTRQNKSNPVSGCLGLVIFGIVAAAMLLQSRQHQSPPSFQTVTRNVPPSPPPPPPRNPIHRQLASPDDIQRREGVAAMVLVDTSGSMNDEVPGPKGKSAPKIAIARRRVLDVIQQTQEAAAANPGRVIQLGVLEFSSRDHMDTSRVVMPLGAPDAKAAETRVNALRADGGTPIGDAIVHAKRLLNETHLSHMHILVITDGANTQGYEPADVVQAMSQIPESDRAAVYFVAFDIGANVFAPVRNAGGLVLAAANDAELKQTLGYVLTGKILAEQVP